MTPQELKNSILQLAIQGKLVEQRPEEGTAEELYQQIQAEAINVDKRDPEISQNDFPFDIPETWKYVRLKNVAILYNGRAYKQTELLSKGKYPVLRVGNLFTNSSWYYSDLELEKEKYCDNGDLLYSWSASFGPHIWMGEKVIYHYHIWKIEYSKYLCRDYLYYFLLADTERIKKSGHGLAMIHVTKAGTEERLIPLPPLAEQRRIVAKIEELLPLIDRYEKAWSRLEEFNKRFPDDMQKSILQMAIQGKLVEQRPGEGSGAELYQQIQEEKQVLSIKGEVYRDKSVKPVTEDCIPFDIPESWFWCRLGDLTRLITKGSSPAWQGVSYTDEANGILFITSENVGDNTMLLNKRKYVEAKFNLMHPSSILKKNDILTNLVGASIGRSALFDDNSTNANINQAVCIIRLVNNSVSDFIRIMLRSEAAIRMMLSDTVDTARANLSLASVSNLLIPLPPLAEQKRIVSKIEDLLPLCNRLL